MAHKWVPYLVDGRPSLAVKRATDQRSGAYAIRRKDSHGVVYVGESDLGRMWRTLARHFQAPESFTRKRKPGGGNAFATDRPEDYEVTWRITSRGKREKKHGDQRAMNLQARWIRDFKKAGHRLKNQNDGLSSAAYEAEKRRQAAAEAAASFDFGANVSDREWYENPGEAGALASSLRCRRVPTRGKRPRLRVVKDNPARVPCLDCGAMTGAASRRCRSCVSKRRADRVAVSEVAAERAADRSSGSGFRDGMAYERAGMDLLRPHIYGGKPIKPRTRARGVALLQQAYAAYDRDELLGGRDAGLLDTESYRRRAVDRRRVAAELGGLGEPTVPEPPAKRTRAAAPPRADVVRPAGYGEVVTEGARKGQIVMFNPRGALTELGRLTVLSVRRGAVVRVLAWPVHRAPVLAYDAAGRLFILYPGKVERAATPAEVKEYKRTHWGAAARGKVRGSGYAVGPFRSLGEGVSITYTTKKGGDAEPVDYVHPWGDGGPRSFTPPTVVEHQCSAASCPEGERCESIGAIALSGGSYRVSEHGIVG